MKKVIVLAIFLTSLATETTVQAQTRSSSSRPSLAVIGTDAININYMNAEIASLIRLEVEKTNRFEVMDRYDVSNILKANNASDAEVYGKSQLVNLGKLLNTDKIISGSIEGFGEKLIITLRLIDVNTDRIERTSAIEYINEEIYIQRMVRMSIYDLLQMEINQEEMEKLKYIERPIIASNLTYNLTGPRFGIQFYDGELRKRLMASKGEGGYNANGFGTTFGFQLETNYLTSGDFAAVIELIGAINGLESGYLSPSIALMQGFRYKGWEFGLGPVIRVSKMAEGFYDANGKWNLVSPQNTGEGYQIRNNIDSRGNIATRTGLIFAAGKVFTSGHVHFPVNVYWSPVPTLNSNIFGVMLGFTIADRSKTRSYP